MEGSRGRIAAYRSLQNWCHIQDPTGVKIMTGKRNMSTPRASEIRWVRQIRGGATPVALEADEDLEAAFEEHWSSVCATLHRLVGDWDEAQDLALEAFWRLYTRPPRDLSRVGGWLHRVATNLGLNAIRARRRRQRYEEEASALRFQRLGSLSPAEAAERRDTQERVRAVLARMKPRKAQLLILRYSGHSYAEIAEILGVAPGSVGTLLARAEKDFERRYRAREDVR
jgi:RNA polymerase sigma-70 factor (ECF subfamily)